MRKEIREGKRYFIISIDEPYAREIYEILKKGQTAKGEWPEGDISFEKWIDLTWPEIHCTGCRHLNPFQGVPGCFPHCTRLNYRLYRDHEGQFLRPDECPGWELFSNNSVSEAMLSKT
jgi:hypothetical protein